MTLFDEFPKRCSVCGSESGYPVIVSTNTFGSADLDTRPPEMQRSTIFAWVQRCPQCGYCASDVSWSRPNAKTTVNEERYRDQLTDPMYPELANSFLCETIIDEEARDYAAATWALIHAAWVCDDADLAIQATVCRQRAADMLVLAEECGQRMTQWSGGGTVILVDLLRRSGRLHEARKAIRTRRDESADDVIRAVLGLQAALIDGGDTSCHTIDEVVEDDD